MSDSLLGELIQEMGALYSTDVNPEGRSAKVKNLGATPDHDLSHNVPVKTSAI
jgi:hypothetical protein